MGEIKREYLYRTTDGAPYFGENAAKRAKDHQRRVDFRKITEDIDVLLDKINDQLYCDFSDFENLVTSFIDLHMEIPEFITFFELIKDRFKEFK